MSDGGKATDAGPVGKIVAEFVAYLAGPKQRVGFSAKEPFLEWARVAGNDARRKAFVNSWFKSNQAFVSRTLAKEPCAADLEQAAKELLYASTFVQIRYVTVNPGHPEFWVAVWIGI
jgi:hypothetical protein